MELQKDVNAALLVHYGMPDCHVEKALKLGHGERNLQQNSNSKEGTKRSTFVLCNPRDSTQEDTTDRA